MSEMSEAQQLALIKLRHSLQRDEDPDEPGTGTWAYSWVIASSPAESRAMATLVELGLAELRPAKGKQARSFRYAGKDKPRPIELEAQA